MALDNEFVDELDATVIRINAAGDLGNAIAVLTANEWKYRYSTQCYGRVSLYIKSSEISKHIMIGVQMVGNDAQIYYEHPISKGDAQKLEEAEYVGTGPISENLEFGPYDVAIADTGFMIAPAHLPGVVFSTQDQSKVYRVNPSGDPIVPIATVEISESGLRNLINKTGKGQGHMFFFVKDNKLAAVIDGEAFCVESFYKADNVTIDTDQVVTCCIPYSVIYDLLYRRKHDSRGLFNRIENEGEQVKCGILGNRSFFVEVSSQGSKITLILPNHEIDGSLVGLSGVDVETIEIQTKTVRRRSKKRTTENEVVEVVEEEVVTEEQEVSESTLSLTEEENNLILHWHAIHVAGGGSSTEWSQWFADYCMSQIQQGLEIGQEHLDLASKL